MKAFVWCRAVAAVVASWWLAGGDVEAAEPWCLPECATKWKSGKRTAECFDRGMIAVPRPMCNDTQVLDISGNDLQILHKDSFEGGISLQKVFIRSCRIGQIDKYAFRGLTNVIEIDLSDNLLTHVPSQAFEDVPYLRNISLARNPLQRVEAFAFRQVPQLQRLDLSYCDIQSIRPKAFDNLNALEYLKLHDNGLRQLPTDTLEGLPRLRSVELHNNQWECDCHLRSIKVYLSERLPNPPLHKILCAGGPERLRNLSLMELDAEDLACRPAIKTEVRNVEAAIGANATLECRIESDPVATVTWYFGNRQMLLSNDTIGDGEDNANDADGHKVLIIESEEDDVFDKRSRLVLRQVVDSDAGEYHCVAENRAGHAEANFTLYATSATNALIALNGTNFNVITAALACLIVFMLVVIVSLLKRIGRGSYGTKHGCTGHEDEEDEEEEDDVVKAKKKHQQQQQQHNNSNHHHHLHDNHHQQLEKGSNSIDTSSQKSHDSEFKSESGKAFTVTSDLSYSRSLSDIGNPTAFSNPDLISGAPANTRDSTCATPITRPISDYCHNWQRSYAMAPTSRVTSASIGAGCYGYDLAAQLPPPHDQLPMVVDTISAGSGSDDVFTHSRLSDYPPDYGLPILPEHQIASQPCAKTLKVWQRGVPVYPPMCTPPALAVPPPPPNFQTLPPQHPHSRQSPSAEHSRYRRCGTDV